MKEMDMAHHEMEHTPIENKLGHKNIKKEEHEHAHYENITGHEHKIEHQHLISDFKKRLIYCSILSIPVIILSETVQSFLGFTFTIPYQELIMLFLSGIIYVYGGLPFLKGSITELKNKTPGMMTLISLAITVSFIYSVLTVFLISGMDFFWELVTLIDIMLLGHWIENKSILGASKALEEIVKIMPALAHLIKGNTLIDVQLSELKKNDVVLVKSGEKIPSDGIVVKGSSNVNESLLTGESKPINKVVKSLVIGGSINEGSILYVKITRTGEETYLAQVINLVKQAQESRSKTQALADRAAGILFYIAIFAGFLTFVAWSILGNSLFGLERAVTVIVIACPHALGLAIPLVVSVSTAITAKKGILIRDRQAFESVKDINAVIFDKTGTLTYGKFGVTKTVSLITEPEMLRLAASVEINSEHVIAKAIVDYANSKNVSLTKVDNFKSIPGKGASGKIGKDNIVVCGPSMLKDLGIKIINQEVKDLTSSGSTVIVVIENNNIIGAFALDDIIREESHEAVNKLQSMGVKVFMLTGDSEDVAKQVAKKLNITDYFSGVLPTEKAAKIKLIKNKGFKTAMVGDGVNDAPALVTADVGIAIGAGTDVAIESADIILVKNNPLDIVSVINFSKKTYTKMVQNLWWATGYNIIALPLAAGVANSLGLVLSPALGALFMSLSTVIVALNSRTINT